VLREQLTSDDLTPYEALLLLISIMVKNERMCVGVENKECSKKARSSHCPRCRTCAAIFKEANNADEVIQAAKVNQKFCMQKSLLNLYVKSSAIACK
jgi:hypothetical protein